MVTVPPMIVSFDVYYGSRFRNQMRDYDYTRSSKSTFEEIDVRDVGLEDLLYFLKEMVPFEHTDVLYYEDDCVPELSATYLRTEDQWNGCGCGISMTIDKRWTTIRHTFNPDFIKGLHAFIERCNNNLDSHGKCSCPCKQCGNTRHHGELPQPPEVHNTTDPLRNFLHDIQLEEVPNFEEEGPNDDETMNDTTATALEDLIDSTQTELYPGRKLSSVEFLAKLTHIKVLNKWTNTSFNQLLELIIQSHPPNNKIPKSFYETKKWMRKIGLGYQAIHACKNDRCLFYKEYQDLENCPICKESRWKDERTTGKKVPNKVLRYFPITPRLKRLYSSRYTAKDMTWHATGRCNEEGKMRHPVHGRAWKEIDKRYPDFAREPRNVRLGLAADGFNPFGNMNNPYSMWPVILATYNTPPWICMKESSLMLTLLIPGSKSPGKDIDVYLRPLVDELKILWSEGDVTHDSVTNTYCQMKAMLIWTINDYPALTDRTLNRITHTDLLPVGNPGKNHTNVGEKRKRPPNCRHNWTKISIFRELEYWKYLPLQHNLDVMHIEKNVLEAILGTLLMNDKSKDTHNARVDLEKLGIRKDLWLKPKTNGKKDGQFFKPLPKYSLKPEDRVSFCKFIKEVKLPDGFGSNFRHKVNKDNTNITNMKSHDCHIMMQRLLPVQVNAFLDETISTPIMQLCAFSKQICARELMVANMLKAQKQLIKLLCTLELIYRPAFFDIMIHLVMHLSKEAIYGGPVYMRWMYPIERYMKKLKNYVRNKAKPEGCIAEGYVADEALTACSMSLEGIQTRFNRPDRYADGPIRSCEFRVFNSLCKFISKGVFKSLARDVQDKLHWYILDNCSDIEEYKIRFKAENPNMDMKTNFPSWFTNQIRELRSVDGSKYSDELICLSEVPVGTSNHYSACNVNGVRFVVSNRDDRRTTQNNGIVTLADVGARVSKYYGRLEDIVELHYGGAFSVVLFRCRWFNTENTRNRKRTVKVNNITSIDTKDEWYEDDQHIFATQAQQVFYIDDPSQTSSSWKVVHEVHHRKLWDRDIIEDTIRDVVHETNSSDLSLDADLDNMTYTSMSVPGESIPIQFDPPTHEVNPPTHENFFKIDTWLQSEREQVRAAINKIAGDRWKNAKSEQQGYYKDLVRSFPNDMNFIRSHPPPDVDDELWNPFGDLMLNEDY
ncbi:uncharacterized protein [Rutidosis leptorrhynchoides]|uniref:uncharacterized protein n=1 Tax=Rutidosis leptorrhynchoides TaxID=125765 RepID=UPI003A997DFE